MKEITIEPGIDGRINRRYKEDNSFPDIKGVINKELSHFWISDIKQNDLIHAETYKVKIPYGSETLEGQFIYDNEYNHNQLVLDGALVYLDK